MTRRLARDDYALDAATLARRLLGCVLVHQAPRGVRLAGRIVETEAYLGVKDRCCHSFAGRRTPRVEPMYGPPGTAYVYFTYGMHHCMNVVCGEVDEPVAVLLRALEPIDGLAAMRRRRATRPSRRGDRRPRAAATPPDAHLCRGPASLCRALGIPLAYSGLDMADPASPIWIEPGDLSRAEAAAIRRTARVGLGQDSPWAARRLRWVVSSSPAASRGPQHPEK